MIRPAGRTSSHGLALLTVALAFAGPAHAQRDEITNGTRDSLRVSWADLGSRCVTPVDNPYVQPPRHSACQVQGLWPLGRGDGRVWYVVRYLRELIVQDSAGADTMPIDQLVLAGRAPGAPDAEVVLHWQSDRRQEFLDSIVAVPTPQGLLLELTLCLNGTGGCGHDYLRLADGRWRVVVQAFLDDLGARLPPDHRLHKGRLLDLRTLEGLWPVAARGDPNCCPSFEMPFRVRLDGDTLRLVDAGPLRRTPDQ